MENTHISDNALDEAGPKISPQTGSGFFDPVMPPYQATPPQPGPESVGQFHFDHGHHATPYFPTASLQAQLGSTSFGAPAPYIQPSFVPQSFASHPFDSAPSPAWYAPSPYSSTYLQPQFAPPQFDHPPPFAHQQIWPQSFGPQSQPNVSRWFNQPANMPHSTITTSTEQEFPAHASLGDPDDLYNTSMRACHIAHRRYIRWINTTYQPSTAPQEFVQEWCDALQEMRRLFGHFHLPDIFVFNQFLAAAAVNPETRAWVDSLHIPMDRFLPPSIMEQVYRDFLVSEARRLNLPLSTWNPQNFTANIPANDLLLSHYCPFHHILGHHSVEDCSLYPRRKFQRKSSDKGSNRIEQ